MRFSGPNARLAAGRTSRVSHVNGAGGDLLTPPRCAGLLTTFLHTSCQNLLMTLFLMCADLRPCEAPGSTRRPGIDRKCPIRVWVPPPVQPEWSGETHHSDPVWGARTGIVIRGYTDRSALCADLRVRKIRSIEVAVWNMLEWKSGKSVSEQSGNYANNILDKLKPADMYREIPGTHGCCLMHRGKFLGCWTLGSMHMFPQQRGCRN